MVNEDYKIHLSGFLSGEIELYKWGFELPLIFLSICVVLYIRYRPGHLI